MEKILPRRTLFLPFQRQVITNIVTAMITDSEGTMINETLNIAVTHISIMPKDSDVRIATFNTGLS
jgi:hypothetical protein